jgi:outer membrane receptor protein involved in Fe transport
MEQVVVSAQKRDERLQDVPIPVTAIGAESLVESNNVRLQDYYSSVPGLSMTSNVGSAGLANGLNLVIRGISTGAGANPTVGVVVDDIPYGSSTSLGGGAIAPDVDPSELQRVEVLRGPQGTLYGASSIGGLLKYVTVNPSTDRLSGRVEGDFGSVHNGNGAGYGLRGAANIPVTDTLAVRVSGFARRDPGYVDDPSLGVNGINRVDVDGGRISALWRPSDVFSLKLSALTQTTKGFGNPTVDVDPTTLKPVAGDLRQQRALPESYRFETRVFSANATTHLGEMTLTSLTGYSVNKNTNVTDVTGILAPLLQPIYGVGTGAGYNFNRTFKFSQELRLAGPTGRKLEWLLGAFYTHEDSPFDQYLSALNPATMQPVTGTFNGSTVTSFQASSFPSAYQEYAAFVDLTWHFTDQWSLQVGGRESQNKQAYEEIDTGPYQFIAFGLPSIFNPLTHTKDSSFTYLITPQFKLSPDVMLYSRIASGYRPGGPNATAAVFHVPVSFKPDKTTNYEIGAKADLLDHVLSLDGSIYYIDWNDIQLQVSAPLGAIYYINASRAKSQGVELSATLRPVGGLTISAWGSWNDAELTANFPADSAAIGSSGDRLPYTARFTGNFSVHDEFALGPRITGFAGASVSYVGRRENNFAPSYAPGRLEFPSYTQTSLHAGARYESWTISAFVNNLTDERGIIGTNLPTFSNIIYIQPRTAGLSVSKSF